MNEFAFELVKGRVEFIGNLIQSKKLSRFKENNIKIKKAERSWNSTISKLFK